MNKVSKTLYIPLYGKAYVSRKGLLLRDETAEQIWAAEGFALKGKARSKWLAYYMAMRAVVFDEWTARQLHAAPDAVVLHLGCGMDSRVRRVGCDTACWYDIDLPAVIEERSRYYQPTEHYRMLAADVTAPDWLAQLPPRRQAIVVMEGLSMYLAPAQLKQLLQRLAGRFEQVSLLMDCYTGLAARASRYKNPINTVGVTTVYGLDDPAAPQSAEQGLLFVKEQLLTPPRLIEQLPGAERAIFAAVYGGRISQKLYRLYEYRKG